MIRRIVKITIIFAILYVISWFAIAHYTKGQIKEMLSSFKNEETEVKYSKINLSGFPFHFKFKVNDAELHHIEGNTESTLSIPYIEAKIDILLHNASLTLAENSISTIKKDNIRTTLYHESDKIVTIYTEWNRSLWLTGGKLMQNLQSVTIPKFTSRSTKNGIEISQGDLEVHINREHKDRLRFQILNNHKATKDIAHIFNLPSVSKIDLDTDIFLLELDSGTIIPYGFDIARAFLEIEDDSFLSLWGGVKLRRGQSPIGELKVHVNNYSTFLAAIIPEKQRDSIKIMLDKIPNNADSASNDLIFNVKFTEEGVQFGGKAVNELKGK